MPTPLKPSNPATAELERVRTLRSEEERATQQRRQEELEGIAAQAAIHRPNWVQRLTAQQRREIKRDAMAIAIALPTLVLFLLLMVGGAVTGIWVVLYTP